MSQKLTIIFDLDGTLVETAPDLISAHNHVMAKYGLESKKSEVKLAQSEMEKAQRLFHQRRAEKKQYKKDWEKAEKQKVYIF